MGKAQQPASENAAVFAAARAVCARATRGRGRGAEALAIALSRLLPRDKRDGALAIVAGCRLIADAIAATAGDDAAGTGGCCGGGGGAGAAIAEMCRARIEAIYAGTLHLAIPRPEFRDESEHVLAAVAETVRRFQVPRSLWLDFITGCVALRDTQRYATWDALRRRLDAVGGGAAAMLSCVLGLTHSDARRHATDLGTAAHLVAIIQDLRAAARPGGTSALMLPLDDLSRCGCTDREFLSAAGAAGAPDERAGRVFQLEVLRARELLAAASEGLLPWLAGDRERLAAAMVVEWHRAALRRMERENFDRPGGDGASSAKATASLPRLLMTMPAAWRLARRHAPRAVPNSPPPTDAARSSPLQ